MAVATTFDLPNFLGELFSLTPTETPALSMIGGLTGGRPAEAKVFTWQDYTHDSPSQPAILEAAVPVSAQRARAERSNVVQIFQYGVDISYTKLAATMQAGTPSAAASPLFGSNQPVQNELDWQLKLKIEKAALDMNFTLHQGVFQNPTDNTTARRTRGMGAAITSNAVAAGGAALADTHINELLAEMHASGAPFRMPVIFTGLFQKQAVSSIYGYAPEDRNVGGVNINVIETDVTRFGIVIDRQVPAGELRIYDLSVLAPRFLPIPGKGFLFVEPMAKTKASEEAQLYGEFGLEYGPEQWHGKITGLATS